jgi:L-asparaginase
VVESGVPVVIVGRGNHEGFSRPHGIFIGGRNLTSTKARLLLMACLMKFGRLPSEEKALREALARYQGVFDTH